MKIHAENSNDRKKNLRFLYDFISEHKLAIVSTVTGDALPESSVVGFAVTEKMEIIFSSFTTSRKYTNIQKNPRVAIVIGWEKGKTVQFEGIAEELSQYEAEKALETTLEKIPTIAKYIQLEHQVLYIVRPKWIRFSDLSIEPWERFEVTF